VCGFLTVVTKVFLICEGILHIILEPVQEGEFVDSEPLKPHFCTMIRTRCVESPCFDMRASSFKGCLLLCFSMH
jgi:hypothetical protein